MASRDQLDAFAATISPGPFGLALLRSEPWAKPARCFETVLQKVVLDGGQGIFGWMFQLKMAEAGEYLIAIHHAVWRASDGFLYDVTPLHPDRNNHPVIENQGTLFLVDRSAEPVTTSTMLAPRPSKFFSLSESPALIARVRLLEQEEQTTCRQLYGAHGWNRCGGH